MTTTRTRSRRRVLSAWAAGLALLAAMLGHVVLSAPQASAACTMTAEGRWFADQLRHSPDPLGTARSLMKMVSNTTPMTAKQAEWEVESAIFVYAPQVIPKIKDQAAQQVPA